MHAAPTATVVHHLFEAHAVAHPEAEAVVCDDARITFGELDARAGAIARELRRHVAVAEMRVGVSLGRSIDLVATLLGILKAGAAWVPIDPSYPLERRELLAGDAKVRLVITEQQHRPANPVPRYLLVEELVSNRARSATATVSPPSRPMSPLTAAYGIQTSGSTGQPKCVTVTHAALLAYVQALSAPLQLSPRDRYIHTASFAFSASVRQLFVPLCMGATVVLAGAAEIRDPAALFSLIARERVSILDTVPSYLRRCLGALAALPADTRGELTSSLRLVMTTGEPLPADTLRVWRAQCGHRARLINLYGQTETTGSVALHEAQPEDLDRGAMIPIGRPLAGTKFCVLDHDLSPVDHGPGELYVLGSSLARGYDDRGMTATRFVPDPVSGPGARMYRTGDVVRVRADGLFEFVTRTDFQVKVRGIRVELGEVEAALRRHPHVEDAVVQPRLREGEVDGLVAYIVAGSNAPTASELRSFMKQLLPEAFVPQFFVALDAFPRTPSGKVDRGALPPPDVVSAGLDDGPPVPAQSPLERLVAQCWLEVLGGGEIDSNSDFFEIGGNSLGAIEVVTRLQEKLPVELPLILLFFRAPTVAGIAEGIESELGTEGLEAIASHLPA